MSCKYRYRDQWETRDSCSLTGGDCTGAYMCPNRDSKSPSYNTTTEQWEIVKKGKVVPYENNKKENNTNIVKPLTPSEVSTKHQASIPDSIIKAVNKLLVEKWNPNYFSATIKQEEVLNIVVDEGLSKNTIFENHWLDFEDIYREAGWKVEYDKPGYNENYGAYWVFKKIK